MSSTVTGCTETFIYRAKVSKPVVSTLARIDQRVALLVQLEDVDGTKWSSVAKQAGVKGE